MSSVGDPTPNHGARYPSSEERTLRAPVGSGSTCKSPLESRGGRSSFLTLTEVRTFLRSRCGEDI